MNHLLRCAATACIALACARNGLSASPATLREGLKPLAKYIRDIVVLDQKLDSINLAEFTPMRKPREMNVRLGIAGELKSLLENDFKVRVDKGSQLSAAGFYDLVKPLDNPEMKVIQVTAVITDQSGRQLARHPEKLEGVNADSLESNGQKPASTPAQPPATKKPAVEAKNPVQIASTSVVAQVAGVTGSIPADTKATQAERNKALQEHAEKPTFYADGTKIRSSQTSPYAVEVLHQGLLPGKEPSLSLADYDPRPTPCAVTNQDGLAFIEDLKPNDLYQVKVYNDTNEDVAISLSVDGVDEFFFSEVRRPDDHQPLYGHWIIYPKGYADPELPNTRPYDGTLLVEGWHKSDGPTDNVLSFRVTSLGKGAAAEAGMKAQGDVGVIHVQFSHCWPKGKRPSGKGIRGLKTERGPSRTVRQKRVEYEFDVPFEFITVRYTQPPLPEDLGIGK